MRQWVPASRDVVMAAPNDIFVGELQIRPHEHAVVAHGQELQLTSREFDIIMMLAEHPGWVFSANQLAGESEEGEYSPESVSVLVSRLRQKLSAVGVTDVVETVRGIGYRLHSAVEVSDEAPATASIRRDLRDAAWQLQEAIIEVEHTGTSEQQLEAIEVLSKARRSIFAGLAE